MTISIILYSCIKQTQNQNASRKEYDIENIDITPNHNMIVAPIGCWYIVYYSISHILDFLQWSDECIFILHVFFCVFN